MGLFRYFFALALPVFHLLAADPADAIFFGGDILTMNDKQPYAEAVAVAAGKILYTGDLAEAKKMQGPNTEMVDLKGNALLPGFINSDTRFLFKGIVEEFVDVSPFAFNDIDDILESLQKAAVKGPVIAYGYDPSLMVRPGDLGFEELERVSREVPILVINLSGDIAYGNRRAFAQAGVAEGSENPPGGSYQRNKQGRLTGKAFSSPAVIELLNGFKTLRLDYPSIALKTAKNYAKHGFTTVTDMSLGIDLPGSNGGIEILRRLANSPNAPVRLQGYVLDSLIDEITDLKKQNTPRFQILGTHISADGSVQNYRAAMLHRYKGKNTLGELNFSEEELHEKILKAHQKDLQIAVAANGDRAIEIAVEGLEKAQKIYPKPDPRFRIEKATVAEEKLLKRMAAAKASPSFTIQHVYYWGKAFKTTILGNMRAEHVDSLRSAKEAGMKFSLNDDGPTTSANSMLMVEIAATRKMLDSKVLNPKETISVLQALKALTICAAWQTFREKELGTIEAGKYADFVELNRNPLKITPERIREIEVVSTWIDGKKVLAD